MFLWDQKKYKFVEDRKTEKTQEPQNPNPNAKDRKP